MPLTRRRAVAAALLLALFGVGCLAGAIVGRAPAAGARAAAVQKLHVLAPGPGDIAVTYSGKTEQCGRLRRGPGGR